MATAGPWCAPARGRSTASGVEISRRMSSWSATSASPGVGKRSMTASPIVLTISSFGPSTSLVRARNAWRMAMAWWSPWASVTAVKPARSTKANVASRSGVDMAGSDAGSARREELGEVLGDRHGLGGGDVGSAGVAERVAAGGAAGSGEQDAGDLAERLVTVAGVQSEAQHVEV